LAIALLIRRPLLGRSRTSLVTLGVLVGLAVLIKPTALPASLACVFAVATIVLLRDWLSSPESNVLRSLRASAIGVFFFILGICATILPYVAIRYELLINYIYATLISDQDFWRYNADFYQQATFYSVGIGGELALGIFFWIGLGLFPARLIASRFRGEADWNKTLPILAAVIIAYLLPTVSPVKSYFLGGMFYGTFIAASALNYAAIVKYVLTVKRTAAEVPTFSKQSRATAATESEGDSWILRMPSFQGTAAVLLLGVTFALAVRSLVGGFHIATRFDSSMIQDINSSFGPVWSAIQERAQPYDDNQAGSPLRIMFSSPYPVTPQAIELQALKAGVPVEIGVAIFDRTVQQAVEHLQQADLMVVTSSMPHNLPGPQKGDDIMRALDASATVCRIDTLALTNGREMRIYARRDAYCNIDAANGS
jgi:hypothetical protein